MFSNWSPQGTTGSIIDCVFLQDCTLKIKDRFWPDQKPSLMTWELVSQHPTLKPKTPKDYMGISRRSVSTWPADLFITEKIHVIV